MQEIVIDISENGDVRIEGKGFAGPECEQLTAELESALGVVEERSRKPEFYRATPKARKVGA